jgi:hypothetical protein
MISHRQMNRQGCKAWIEEDNRPDIDFARRNVRRQELERRLRGMPGLAGRAVRKGRRILAALSH